MELPGSLSELFFQALNIVLHLDIYLNQAATWLGPGLYFLLFAIIFCETGLVVTPFLPGDSLLFAVGALSALDGSPINLVLIWILLMVAAVFGDAVNYSVGKFLGPKVFSRTDSFWLNRQHLVRTQAFYERHGGKTIILARFVPIVRTFAPFVAGVGSMAYRRFAIFNVSGAVVWVTLFLFAGRFFGNLPAIKQNFHLVLVGIIFISVLPILIEYWRGQVQSKSRR